MYVRMYLCIRVFECKYICMYVCTYVCILIYVHVYQEFVRMLQTFRPAQTVFETGIGESPCSLLYVCKYVYLCMYMYVCMYVCKFNAFF